MFTRRNILLLASIFVLSVPEIGHSQAAKPDTLRLAIGADMSGRQLDPATSQGGYATMFVFNVFDGLFKFDRDGKVIPGLASKHEVSVDGLTHTLTIRDGVLFHDGTPLTAEDVKFSLDRARGVDPSEPNPTVKS